MSASKARKPKKARVKKYTGRYRDLQPIVFGLDAENARMLKLKAQVQLSSFIDGRATEMNWETIACRLNIGGRMAETIYQEHYADLEAALAAIVAVKKRFERTGIWGMAGEEYKAVGTGLWKTDDMQSLSTRRQLVDVMEHVFTNYAVL